MGFFFAAFLAIGLLIYRDYGVSWDEFIQRIYGHVVYRYVTGLDERLLTFRVRFYGPVFEALLAAVEFWLNMVDIRKIYFMRHLLNFLMFFTGAWFFYKLCAYQFKNRWWGLLGVLLLVLSPRIFSHAFYNSKDLPFMSMYMIAMYTMVRFLDAKSLRWAVFHAIACALTIDIRVMGVIIPCMTLAFYFLDWALKPDGGAPLPKMIGNAVVYGVLLSGFTVLFWPTLWQNPIGNFLESFNNLGKHPWGGSVLYWGNEIRAEDIPWHYVPVWIGITTPIVYSAAFLIGSVLIPVLFLKSPVNFLKEQRNLLIYWALVFAPIAVVIGVRSVLYDSWRQMYFIYPSFLLIALAGIRSAWSFFTAHPLPAVKFLRYLFALALIAQCTHMVRVMILYHPFQDVYFNRFAGKDLEDVKARFELDYWGLSYRNALTYIVKTDLSPSIPVFAANSPGKSNVAMLDPEDRDRIDFVKRPQDAKYFMTNYRHHKNEYQLQDEYYWVKVNGAKIMSVFRLPQ